VIKAVFFDFYNTLVKFEPPRERLHVQACKGLGIEVEEIAIRRSLPMADEFYHKESLKSPIRSRSDQDQKAFYTQYEMTLLKGAGVEVSAQIAWDIISLVRQQRPQLLLYDDVLPILSWLKGRGLTIGIISNVDRDINGYCQNLGLNPILDLVVTSVEVGVGKPGAAIFFTALTRAGVEPEAAVHIGDQYRIDVMGAKGVGMKALLIDRDDFYPEITDCPRLHSLWEVQNYL